MSKIIVTADSTCDLDQGSVDKYGIVICPLYVRTGEGEYRDGVDITAAKLFEYVSRTGQLPKTIVYSLDPNDNAAIETVIGAFQTGEAVGKVQHGSAWWFNDHKRGMIYQMTSLASEGYLAGFVGMLTDSRSFLSYARHEYFRRILCELIGSWVENGEYPNDEKSLKTIVEGICVKNAERYFEL